MPPGDDNTGSGIQPYPPPRSSSVDPFGLQTASTGATATGLGLTAIGGAGTTVASALGLSASSAKILTAGLSLQAVGHMSLSCAGLVLIGLGIVLNVASLVIRRQQAHEYDNADYVRIQASRTQKSGGSSSEPYP